jgi:hypothetical protein
MKQALQMTQRSRPERSTEDLFCCENLRLKNLFSILALEKTFVYKISPLLNPSETVFIIESRDQCNDVEIYGSTIVPLCVRLFMNGCNIDAIVERVENFNAFSIITCHCLPDNFDVPTTDEARC